MTLVRTLLLSCLLPALVACGASSSSESAADSNEAISVSPPAPSCSYAPCAGAWITCPNIPVDGTYTLSLLSDAGTGLDPINGTAGQTITFGNAPRASQVCVETFCRTSSGFRPCSACGAVSYPTCKF